MSGIIAFAKMQFDKTSIYFIHCAKMRLDPLSEFVDVMLVDWTKETPTMGVDVLARATI
jgi:hypothetical protein